MVGKAATEKKMIFVDCYTSWCIPCKRLATEVFPDEGVGRFFNEHFVNVQYDMEKDSVGVWLRKKYPVRAYPTLLFIDPETEEVVHKVVGGVNVEQMLAVGEQAIDPKGNWKGLEARFEQGERGAEFLKAYFVTLMFAGEREKQEMVAAEYLAQLSIKDFAKEENWQFLNDYGSDPLSKTVKNIVDSLDYACQTLGREKLETYLYNVFYYPVYEISIWETRVKKEFDEERSKELERYLKKLNGEYVPGMLAMLSTAEFVRQRDFAGMLDEMRKNIREEVFAESQDVTYFCVFIDQLALCEDESVLQEAIDWLQEKLEGTDDLNLKSNYVRRKGNLLQQMGKEKEAKEAFAAAENYMKMWQEENQRKLKQINQK